MKSGQATLFIIIGVVMIIVFGLIFYMVRINANSGMNPNLNRVTSSQVDFASIHSYIEACLEDVSKSAIERVGYQGGNLFDYQVDGGVFFDTTINVTYQSEYDGEKYNLTLAMWDETNLGYSDIVRNVKLAYPPERGTYPYGLNRFGRQPTYANIPKLCMTGGTHGGASLTSSCESFDPYQSTQELLQKYIQNKTPECFNFEPYKDEKGYNITIGELNVSVIMGEENVISILQMPVHVSIMEDDETPVETKMGRFVVDLPIRLRQIHELAWHMLEHDAKNIFFNMKAVNNMSVLDCRIYNGSTELRTETGTCLKNGMSVKFIKNESKTYGFLIIEDSKSLLMSHKPYQFVIAIDNRKPHIDKISYYNYSEGYKTYLSGWYSTSPENLYSHATRYPLDEKYDIIVDAGEYLTIIPYAIDPDEDCDPKTRTVMDKTYSYSSSTLDHIFSSTYHFTGTPYDWGGKDIRYLTTLSDVGDHTVKVTVTDPYGYSNSKTLRIDIRCVDPNFNDDYSSPMNLDTDEYNDCCNERGGYNLFTTQAHSCGLCKRCNNTGGCEFFVDNETLDLQECGACNKCNISVDGCSVDDSMDNTCPSSEPRCCRGGCTKEIDIDDPSIDWSECLNPTYHYDNLIAAEPKNADCWTPTKECIKFETEDPDGVNFKYRCLVGLYTNKPVSGSRAQTTNPLDPCNQCNEGMCNS